MAARRSSNFFLNFLPALKNQPCARNNAGQDAQHRKPKSNPLNDLGLNRTHQGIDVRVSSVSQAENASSILVARSKKFQFQADAFTG